MVTPTSESESETYVFGHELELDEPRHASHSAASSSSRKRFRKKTIKRDRHRDDLIRGAGSSGRDHRHVPYKRGSSRGDHHEIVHGEEFSESESDIDDPRQGNSKASCSKTAEHHGRSPTPTTTTQGKCFKFIDNNVTYPTRPRDNHSRDDMPSLSDSSSQEGAVTFRSTKKLHRHHRKRPLCKVKCRDQEKMAPHKNSHQHSAPSDLAIYCKTNNFLPSGLIPVNININAVFHTSSPYVGSEDGGPVTKRRKKSLSSDLEAISDSEIRKEALPIDKKRTKSLLPLSEVFTIGDSSPDYDGGDLRTKCPPKRISSSPDVIIISSDSDHQDTTSHLQPNHVDTLFSISDDQDVDDETFVRDILGQYDSCVDDDDEHDADTDSDSDLPDVPILHLEEVSKNYTVPSSSNAQPRYDEMRSYNAPSLIKKDEDEIETIEPECVKIEPVHSSRSIHSLGDLGDREEEEEEEEEATNSCWMALSLAAGDTKASDLSVRKYQNNQCGSRSFSCDKRNVVYACNEEECTEAAVNLVAKFTSTVHKPPPQLLQELYHDTLRKRCRSYSEALKVYRCLKTIQHLHHPSCRDFPIEWDHIKATATCLVSAPSEGDLSPCIKWHIDMLSLNYLVSILEDDIERKSRWDTLKKSFAFSILNPENCRNNCREVVEWIHRLVSELEPSQEISCGCSDSACHRNYVLPMLGKLLEFSFQMTNSWTRESYLQRTIEELNNRGLKGLPQMRLLLETLQQPWLRLKLCDLLFNSRFESEIFGISRENISVSRIVQEYFLYLPRPAPALNNNKDCEGVMVSGFTRSSREQMVYLLLVMLQSYLNVCSGGPSKEEQGKKSKSKSSALWSSPSRKKLSDDDRICLLQMGDYVDQLRNHLRSSSPPHHSGEMSMVTEVCLAQMSVLYEWM